MLYFNKAHKPCEDINPTVPDVNNTEKRGIIGQEFFLIQIYIDDSHYAGDEENVFASEIYDSFIGEFLLELRRSLMLQLQTLALLQKNLTIC